MATPTPSALSLLQHLHTSHPPVPGTPSATEIHTSQINHKPLLLRPTSPDPTSQDARSVRRKKRLSASAKKRAARKPLSAKVKRKLGVHDLELQPGSDEFKGRRRTKASWEVWKGLWRLWVGYVREVLELGKVGEGLEMRPQQVGPKITSLDFHGAMVRVVKSNCSSLVGVWGVCVRETKGGFVLVDDKCVIRRVNKKGVVFRIEIPLIDKAGEDIGGTILDLNEFMKGRDERVAFEISGSAIECRPAERATKKFKGRKYDGF